MEVLLCIMVGPGTLLGAPWSSLASPIAVDRDTGQGALWGQGCGVGTHGGGEKRASVEAGRCKRPNCPLPTSWSLPVTLYKGRLLLSSSKMMHFSEKEREQGSRKVRGRPRRAKS